MNKDDPSYNANGTRMSQNQLAEQWFAYRLWAADPRVEIFEFEHPHTLNRNTSDSAMRKYWRFDEPRGS